MNLEVLGLTVKYFLGLEPMEGNQFKQVKPVEQEVVKREAEPVEVTIEVEEPRVARAVVAEERTVAEVIRLRPKERRTIKRDEWMKVEGGFANLQAAFGSLLTEVHDAVEEGVQVEEAIRSEGLDIPEVA